MRRRKKDGGFRLFFLLLVRRTMFLMTGCFKNVHLLVEIRGSREQKAAAF